jgi:hypothetical protein
MNNRNHGGRRAGSGRKKERPETLTYTFRLTPAQTALLKLWGGGNASAGLRWLMNVVAPLVRKAEKETK